MEWDYLPTRFWVGAWTAVLLLLLVVTDASALVGFITRFTEEAFATLIALIFVIQAFEQLYDISHHFPITTEPKTRLQDACTCNVSQIILTNFSCAANETQQECLLRSNATVSGDITSSGFHPDVFMFSVILFFATVTIAISLKFLRYSGFLPSKIRNVIADFNVFLAIAIVTAINWFVGLEVPGLAVPDEFKPTTPRSWLVNPGHVANWWLVLAAVFPAIFFTILVFMDQQITAVIINRKDNKLEKGHGYHLDLVVIALLMVICAATGIPFYVAATVISIMHLESLKRTSETAAPGEKPTFLGVREQRVTALIAHLLIGLSVFLTPVLKLIPLPALLGIFLYMGFVTLMGQQFVSRVAILFMPMKHQPDYPWLRAVHLKRVHLFTLFQVIGLVLLFIVKYIKQISMLFPLMLIVMIAVRIVIGRLFTDYELNALDDQLPGWKELMSPRGPQVDQDNKNKKIVDVEVDKF